MKRSSYGEQDYAFGQVMLTMRSTIGLTQASLAELLGVSRRAVGKWEAGSAYPKAEHLKALLAFAVKQQAFAAGREEEEIRAFWKAAHQKVLLNESWLSTLVSLHHHPLEHIVPPPIDVPGDAPPALADPVGGPRVEWGEALDVPSFYGREGELATLAQWVVQERCRVVSVLGMGGIGKSALVTSAMRRMTVHFQVVIFRSLRDAPACETLVEDCLKVLTPQPLHLTPADLEHRLSLLLEHLRAQRVLLVLDNLESLFLEGEMLGLRAGYEGYARLLRSVAETAHQSCLLLTSREKPAELRAMEGRKTLVRSLRLLGLGASACEQLLTEHELVGSSPERARLGERYEGNPLALQIVAETITDLFAGAIGPFLAQDTLVFGSISDLLDEQFARLSDRERMLLLWLAIVREPVSLEELRAMLVGALPMGQVLESVDGLRRRSLIEHGQRPGSFTLQSVVLEYVSTYLVAQASEEIEQGQLALLIQYGLSQAQAKDYVRQTQQRLLVAPLLERLKSAYRGDSDVEDRLLFLLDQMRAWNEGAQGYAPANLVTLLCMLRGNLRGLDLSRLVLRGVYLQGVEMQDATLVGALIRESIWTSTFNAISAVAISRSGQYWAAGSRRGEVRVWREAGQILHLVWQAHTTNVITVAFSPDERTLASASFDGSITLWDVESRALLWSGLHTQGTNWLAFAPDGGLLASGSNDASVRLWDPLSGRQLETLSHPGSVFAVSWSPDGRLLVSGGSDGHIRVWEIQKTQSATCVQTLSGHSNWVRGLAFAPDGSRLASASWDGSIKLWEAREGENLRACQTLTGHRERVHCVAWSPDGHTLASGGFDHTIRLWDTEEGSTRVVLQGHSAVVNGLAFVPNSRSLLSGSDDGTLRLWDVESGQCVRVLEGYAPSLLDVAWSPNGTQLASAGSDTLVTIWEVVSGTLHRVLRGHRWTVYGVGWRPDGSLLASSGWDNTIRLWDPATGICVQVLRDLDHFDTIFFGMAWSPDGRLLASGAYQQGVRVWDVTRRDPRLASRAYTTWIRRVAWSPDGTRLAGGGEDGNVYVWDASDSTQFLQLAGHRGIVTCVAWSPDGTLLASGGGNSDGGELFVWDAHSRERVQAFEGHLGVVFALTWAPSGELVVSGGSDGRLRWWKVHSGECVRMQEAHQGTVQALKVSPDGRFLASCGDDGAITLWDLERGEHLRTLRRDRPYERLDITGIKGLTEAQKATLRALGAIENAAGNSPEHAPQVWPPRKRQN